MDADLVEYEVPPAVLSKAANLADHGLLIACEGDPPRPDAPPPQITARVDGKRVGEISGLFRNGDGTFGFSKISVHESWRNRGIGKSLLAEALRICREVGGTRMRLWTRPPTAERFYKPMGFHVACNFDTYVKQLPQDLTSEAWIARHRYV